MIHIQTIDLVYTYLTDIRALDGVNFNAEPGDFIALLGPNGSGKTTLLKHFVGLLKPTSGKVLFDGRDICDLPIEKVRTDVGFVFQDPNDQLFATTVAEDVAFGPKNLGLAPLEVERRVVTALEIVGARGLESRPIHSLSYGQKRRVSLAGVIAMSPKMLVLDEPTAGLDPMGATRMMALLRRINEEHGVTVVVATHDVDLVPAYAERVYLMRNGRVIASGSPPAIFSRPEVLHQSELRVPRAAHALRLVGDELGHSIIDLPLTMEDVSAAQHNTDRYLNGYDRGHNSNARLQRSGFTTGVAAAAAAKAAAELLLRSKSNSEVQLRSPLGSIVRIPVARAALSDEGVGAIATVIKEGVSPDDVTHGAEICAFVTLAEEPGIAIDGGTGVGRVVKRGLALGVGEAAINPVPRQMIADALSPMLPTGKGLKVVISVPQGEELAKRTNNAEMGIVGGIAILGTSIGEQR